MVERSFNNVKQCAGWPPATNLAIVYCGAAVQRAITIWLKHL